jgi:hypothetical protein
MVNNSTSEKLNRLKALLNDYSFPERIYEGMLREIDQLLTWAIQTMASPGTSADDVREVLGDPFVEIGGGSTFSWLYPCEPPEGEIAFNDLQGSWYYDLRFKDDRLVSAAKENWRFTK